MLKRKDYGRELYDTVWRCSQLDAGWVQLESIYSAVKCQR